FISWWPVNSRDACVASFQHVGGDAGVAATRTGGVMAVMTGLTGNENYCLRLKGMTPGDLVVGNSVFSMGFLGSLGAAGRGLLGGEITQITGVIHEGRLEAYRRMVHEAEQRGGLGITGVTNELRTFHGNSEFLSVASCIHRED